MKKLIILSAILAVMVCHMTVYAVEANYYVVDVQKVLSDSRAAAKGREHLQEVRKALESGYADLKTAWSKAGQSEREAVLADGARKLAAQLALEEQAVTRVITDMMLDEIKKWRRTNKAGMVLPRQNTLDVDEGLDITKGIIFAMDDKEPNFASLPVINVKGPEQEAKPAARKSNPQAPGVRVQPARKQAASSKKQQNNAQKK